MSCSKANTVSYLGVNTDIIVCVVCVTAANAVSHCYLKLISYSRNTLSR